MSDTSFAKKSYYSHSVSFKDYIEGEEKEHIAKSWLSEDNVNVYRLNRIYRLLDPILTLFPHTNWLTVGDGRYGLDSIYLNKKGVNAFPTDISDQLLKEAAKMNLITNYKKENAENLSFENDSFDFVFCKEAYHHFPRPSIALYEMLRVAKVGVILIEPIDRQILPWHQDLFLKGKNLLKRLLKKNVEKDFFEEDGNYLYAMSKREGEKFALGLGLSKIIFNGINDIYFSGLENTPLDDMNPVFKKLKRKIKFYNFFTKLGLIPYNLLFTFILKKELSLEQEAYLKQFNFEIVTLPKNPYLSA